MAERGWWRCRNWILRVGQGNNGKLEGKGELDGWAPGRASNQGSPSQDIYICRPIFASRAGIDCCNIRKERRKIPCGPCFFFNPSGEMRGQRMSRKKVKCWTSIPVCLARTGFRTRTGSYKADKQWRDFRRVWAKAVRAPGGGWPGNPTLASGSFGDGAQHT